jgi:hypothetical protein
MARWYLTSQSPGFSPSALRGAWDINHATFWFALATTQGGSSFNLNASPSAGPGYDGCLWRGVSSGLAAGVISGTVNFAYVAKELSASANDVFHVHLYVTAGDSDTVRGTLLADAIDTNELPTTSQAWSPAAPIAVTPVTVQAGDRLVLELGYRHDGGTGDFIQTKYGGTGTDAVAGGPNTGVPWIDVPDPVAGGGTARAAVVIVG